MNAVSDPLELPPLPRDQDIVHTEEVRRHGRKSWMRSSRTPVKPPRITPILISSSQVIREQSVPSSWGLKRQTVGPREARSDGHLLLEAKRGANGHVAVRSPLSVDKATSVDLEESLLFDRVEPAVVNQKPASASLRRSASVPASLSLSPTSENTDSALLSPTQCISDEEQFVSLLRRNAMVSRQSTRKERDPHTPGPLPSQSSVQSTAVPSFSGNSQLVRDVVALHSPGQIQRIDNQVIPQDDSRVFSSISPSFIDPQGVLTPLGPNGTLIYLHQYLDHVTTLEGDRATQALHSLFTWISQVKQAEDEFAFRWGEFRNAGSRAYHEFRRRMLAENNNVTLSFNQTYVMPYEMRYEKVRTAREKRRDGRRVLVRGKQDSGGWMTEDFYDYCIANFCDTRVTTCVDRFIQASRAHFHQISPLQFLARCLRQMIIRCSGTSHWVNPPIKPMDIEAVHGAPANNFDLLPAQVTHANQTLGLLEDVHGLWWKNGIVLSRARSACANDGRPPSYQIPAILHPEPSSFNLTPPTPTPESETASEAGSQTRASSTGHTTDQTVSKTSNQASFEYGVRAEGRSGSECGDATSDRVEDQTESERRNRGQADDVHLRSGRESPVASQIKDHTNTRSEGDQTTCESQDDVGDQNIYHANNDAEEDQAEREFEGQFKDRAEEDHVESESEDHVESKAEDHANSQTEEDHVESKAEDHANGKTEEDHVDSESEDHVESKAEDHANGQTKEDHVDSESEDHANGKTEEDHVDSESEDHANGKTEEDHVDSGSESQVSDQVRGQVEDQTGRESRHQTEDQVGDRIATQSGAQNKSPSEGLLESRRDETVTQGLTRYHQPSSSTRLGKRVRPPSLSGPDTQDRRKRRRLDRSPTPSHISSSLMSLGPPLTTSTRTPRRDQPLTITMPIQPATRLQYTLLDVAQHDATNSHNGKWTSLPQAIQANLARDILDADEVVSDATVRDAIQEMADGAVANECAYVGWLDWLRGYQLGTRLARVDTVDVRMQGLLSSFVQGFSYDRAATIVAYPGLKATILYRGLVSLLRDTWHNGWLTDDLIVAALVAYVERHRACRTSNRDYNLEPYVLDPANLRLSRDNAATRLRVPQGHRGDIYIPVHRTNHWSLVILVRSTKSIVNLDSLSDKDTSHLNEKLANDVVACLDLGSDWTVDPARSTRQRDHHSCGMFVLENARSWMNGGRPCADLGPSRRADWVQMMLVAISRTQQAQGLGWTAPDSSAVLNLPAHEGFVGDGVLKDPFQAINGHAEATPSASASVQNLTDTTLV